MNIQRNITTDTRIREYDNGNAVYYDAISSIYADIIEEHYINRYNNTIFLCTPCYPHFTFDGSTLISKEMVDKYERIIFCNFDHYIYEDYKNGIFDWCRQIGVTDIWEWQISILQKYPDDLKRIVSFMPMRYVTKYEPFAIQPVQNPKFLYVFCGHISNRRYNFISTHSCNYIPYKLINGINYMDNVDEFKDCACVLNIHGMDEIKTQEQLRIHEFLCLNIPVVSEVSDVNYFGDLITEITEDDIHNLYGLVTSESIKINQSPAAGYKALTYNDEDFERYRSILLQYHKVI